jgi:hypothetical protein
VEVEDGGGAIYATGADVKIYTSIFVSNSAEQVRSFKAVLRIFLTFSLKFPARHMQLTSTGRYSLDSTPVATKLGPVQRGESQL